MTQDSIRARVLAWSDPSVTPGAGEPGLNFVVVYDFATQGSRSRALAATQLANFAQHLGWSNRNSVTAVCVGPVPPEVRAAAATAGAQLLHVPTSDPPVPSVPFSRKLHVIELLRAGKLRRDRRMVLLDHDVLFLEPPRLLAALPPNGLAAKLDPLRRIHNADWLAAETRVGTTGIPGLSVPAMHVVGGDAAPPIPACQRLYFNTGVLVLPEGPAALQVLDTWRGMLEAVHAAGITTPAVVGSDQFALSLAAATQRVVRLDATLNFQANDLLQGYRPGEITAVHFAGNCGNDLEEILGAFLANMGEVADRLASPLQAAPYHALARDLHADVRLRLGLR